MKLSKETIAIFKNFAGINPNLVLNPGNKITTISPMKFVYAEATVQEHFPVTFGIYDLPEFLSILSIFSDPEIDFDPERNSLLISEGKVKVRFGSADLGILMYPKKQNLFPESPEICFDLPQSLLNQITKSASVLKAPFVSIIGDGETILVNVCDKNVENSNSMQIEVGETEHTFCINLKAELFKMMSADYKFYISSQRRGCKLAADDKFYMLAWEQDSTFEV